VHEGADSVQAILADLLEEVRGLRMDMVSVFEALSVLVQALRGDSARAISGGFSEHIRLSRQGGHHDDEGA
jgi:hypothetical protein